MPGALLGDFGCGWDGFRVAVTGLGSTWMITGGVEAALGPAGVVADGAGLLYARLGRLSALLMPLLALQRPLGLAA